MEKVTKYNCIYLKKCNILYQWQKKEHNLSDTICWITQENNKIVNKLHLFDDFLKSDPSAHDVSSQVRLFVDYCLLYRNINSKWPSWTTEIPGIMSAVMGDSISMKHIRSSASWWTICSSRLKLNFTQTKSLTSKMRKKAL